MVSQFIRFLIVASALAIASITLLESLEWMFPIESPVIHGVIVSAIYLAGVVINFQFQKGWVFKTSRNASLLVYATWMIFCAGLVGVISGFVFGWLQHNLPDIPMLASVSLVVALSINAPVSFLGVRVLMREH